MKLMTVREVRGKEDNLSLKALVFEAGEHKDIASLKRDMKMHPENYDEGISYTLHDEKPVLKRVRTETFEVVETKPGE